MSLMRSNKQSYLVPALFLLSILLFFVDTHVYLRPLHSTIEIFSVSARRKLSVLSLFISSPLVSYRQNYEQVERLRNLTIENATLYSLVAQMKSLEEENLRMRSLLGTDIEPAWEYTIARVVNFSADILDVTTDSDVVIGTPALVTAEIEGSKHAGIFIGRLHDGVGRVKKIITPTHVSSKISVVIKDSMSGNRLATGIVLGRGGKMFLDQVLTTENLKENALVVTSGSGEFPADLALGLVGKIYPVVGSAWQQADVKPLVDLTAEHYIFFITKF